MSSQVYVGELVETARAVMDEWHEPVGPIRPRHLREAFRRLQETSVTPPLTKFPKRLFKR